MGFEPTTSAVTGRRSNQLSHQAIISRIKRKWTFGDSNPGPTGYEPVALTNWAKGPKSRQSESNQQPADYKSAALPLSHVGKLKPFVLFYDSKGIWTPDTTVKGWCLNRLTMEPYIFIKIRMNSRIPHTHSYSSPSRARTYNNSVNSRVLYHWAIEEYN